MINSEKLPEIFSYYPPQGDFKGILSIPHSGEDLPEEFRPFVTSNSWDLMQDVDYKVHELVDINELQNNGIAVIYSHIIRTAVDLNRAKDVAVLNWKKNSKGVSIVEKEPHSSEIIKFQEKYYTPYYEMLKTMILELQTKRSMPPLIDLHSMPSQAEEYHMRQNPNQEKNRPDFCLSDDHGTTCEENFINTAGEELKAFGYKVLYNNPYVGGNITKFLHKTYHPLNNFQIEISRGLYMNETNKELKTDFIKIFKPQLTQAIIKALSS